jgi:MFS transporter, PPP family, 3-phenylpropionic acid transporter
MTFKLPPKDLFFARLYYFTFMGGWGFILPFANLFYISLGFSGKQIGFISSTSAIVGMIASPIWVSTVKRHPAAQRILQTAIVLGAIGYFLLGHQTSFLPILFIIFLHSLAASGIMPLSDSMAVTVSQESGMGYGSIRAWASLGWIASLLSSGQLVQRFGYLAAFIGVASMWIISSTVVFFIQPRYFTHNQTQDQPRPGLRIALQRVFQDRTLLGFAVALIAIGFLNSGVLQFENVFLAQLGASKSLISVAGILSAIVELPFMIYADRFVHRIGAHRLMLIALSLTFFQRLTVLILPFIPTIMIVRFIGGVAFSFYTISFVGLISSRTQSAETGTVLALFTVTITGLVNIIAAPFGGAIFDAVGARWLYAFSALGYIIGATSLWLTRPHPSPLLKGEGTSSPAQA